MGYGNGMFAHLTALAMIGSLREGGRVLELGSQNINEDIPAAQIAKFISTCRPNAVVDTSAISNIIAARASVSAIYEMAGLRYMALDVFEAPATRIFDLNFDRLQRYECDQTLVTNFGTSEHVMNQFNVFKTVHDAAAVGGIMFHFVPTTGHWNHGLFNYQPKFFAMLATANDYDILNWEVTGPYACGSDEMIGCTTLDVTGHWTKTKSEAAQVMAVFRKRHDAPFKLVNDTLGNQAMCEVADIDAIGHRLGMSMNKHRELVAALS